MQALGKGYKWSEGLGGRYQLSRIRFLIANYNPELVPMDERAQLFNKFKEWPPNDILVDIRPGYPGGDYPIQGKLSLRSFNEILEFIARGLGEQPEFGVEPDPRTGPVGTNPSQTLAIVETARRPEHAAVLVQYDGRFYALEGSHDGGMTDLVRWNLQAFRLLSQLFQMTVTSQAVPPPGIAIAK